MGLKWAYRRLRVAQMAGLISSGGVILAAVVMFRCSGYTIFSQVHYKLAGVVLLLRSTVMHERFWKSESKYYIYTTVAVDE